MCDRHADNPFGDMPVIFSYTRAQAIEDGVLVRRLQTVTVPEGVRENERKRGNE